LQWYVPGLLLICYYLGNLRYTGSMIRVLSHSGSLILCGLIILHFFLQSDKQVCFEWSFQANNKQVLYDLYDRHPVHPRINPVLRGVYHNYYAVIDQRFSQTGRHRAA